MQTYNVGRQPDPSQPRIVISGDKTVSQSHCRISSLGNGYFNLEDSRSTNGTFVREPGGWRRIERIQLRPDDQIRLGNHVTTIAELLKSAVDTCAPMKFVRSDTGEVVKRPK
jgi:pSer/pThr/pTyr-binding forkhead associated (FHA) protein